jgi:thiosulfate dehydrogenase
MGDREIVDYPDYGDTGDSSDMRSILAFILGILIIPAIGFAYFRVGHPPVAVADKSLFLERQIVRVPLHARIDKEMPPSAPIAASTENLVAGAKIYREQCAFCHGLMGNPSTIASHMHPSTPQLWSSHRAGVVGVSDDPPGETYWKVANGIRLTGMPAFGKTLSDTEMWQVSLLLANADKPLPPGPKALVTQALNLGELSPSVSQPR